MFEGRLLDIHIAEAARAPMRQLSEAQLVAGHGIEGDRYASGTGTYSQIPDVREVTLIEVESLEALLRDHQVDLTPSLHRRNLTTRAVPLNHLVGRRFAVGEVVLEGGRLNWPCRYLDMITGLEVCDRLTNRSGLNCRIVTGGTIRPGDVIRPL
jgi:MOSC domain-containing protein YiiM